MYTQISYLQIIFVHSSKISASHLYHIIDKCVCVCAHLHFLNIINIKWKLILCQEFTHIYIFLKSVHSNENPVYHFNPWDAFTWSEINFFFTEFVYAFEHVLEDSILLHGIHVNNASKTINVMTSFIEKTFFIQENCIHKILVKNIFHGTWRTKGMNNNDEHTSCVKDLI